MHVIGELKGATRSLAGDLILQFAVDEDALSQLEDLKGKELIIDAQIHRAKRSLNANAYFWKLCDMIAKKLGSDKDTIYLLQLSKHGVFVDVELIEDALPAIKRQFRYVDEIESDHCGYVIARCYLGSSTYNTKEMSELISGTVNDAHDLGIETWTREEIEALIREWRCK